MAPVPGWTLFITFSLTKGGDDKGIADRLAREVAGVSRRYPCGLPFAVGPSRIVIKSGEEPIDDDVLRKLAEDVRELLRGLGDEYGITDVRVTTE